MFQQSLAAEIIVSVLLLLLSARYAEAFVMWAPSGFLVLFAPVMLAAVLGGLGFHAACWIPLLLLVLGFVVPARTTPRKGHIMCASCHTEWKSSSGNTGYETCFGCKADYERNRESRWPA